MRKASRRNNQITSLDPLKGMDKLRALYCERNSIATLAPLSKMDQLQTLYCRGNRIEDLSPLKGKPIYALDCSHNLVSSLDRVSELSALDELHCSSNFIGSLEPLRHAKNLASVDCSTNEIKTLEPLKDLKLDYLDCSGNRLETLEPFVDSKDPPPLFVFDCNTLPDEEVERAIAAWSAKRDLRFNVNYGEILLAFRHD